MVHRGKWNFFIRIGIQLFVGCRFYQFQKNVKSAEIFCENPSCRFAGDCAFNSVKRPSECHSDALPAALRPRVGYLFVFHCMFIRCSFCENPSCRFAEDCAFNSVKRPLECHSSALPAELYPHVVRKIFNFQCHSSAPVIWGGLPYSWRSQLSYTPTY